MLLSETLCVPEGCLRGVEGDKRYVLIKSKGRPLYNKNSNQFRKMKGAMLLLLMLLSAALAQRRAKPLL
jgi:hypothetical protein